MRHRCQRRISLLDGAGIGYGDGTAHAGAARFEDRQIGLRFAQGEVGDRGGFATSVAHAVAEALEDQPLPRVSPIVQVAIVGHNNTVIKYLERERRGAWTIANERADPSISILRNWSEYKAATKAKGLVAAAGTT